MFERDFGGQAIATKGRARLRRQCRRRPPKQSPTTKTSPFRRRRQRRRECRALAKARPPECGPDDGLNAETTSGCRARRGGRTAVMTAHGRRGKRRPSMVRSLRIRCRTPCWSRSARSSPARLSCTIRWPNSPRTIWSSAVELELRNARGDWSTRATGLPLSGGFAGKNREAGTGRIASQQLARPVAGRGDRRAQPSGRAVAEAVGAAWRDSGPTNLAGRSSSRPAVTRRSSTSARWRISRSPCARWWPFPSSKALKRRSVGSRLARRTWAGLTCRLVKQDDQVVVTVEDDGAGNRSRSDRSAREQLGWRDEGDPLNAHLARRIRPVGERRSRQRKRNLPRSGPACARTAASCASSTCRRVACVSCITMPLAMAVLDGMVVRVGEVMYIVPIDSIQRIVHSGASNLMRISAAEGATC